MDEIFVGHLYRYFEIFIYSKTDYESRDESSD